MSLAKTLKRASTKSPKAPGTVQKKFEAAYIIPAEIGDRMKAVLLELPMKHSQLIGPMIDALHKAYRSDVTLSIPKEMIQPPVDLSPLDPKKKETEETKSDEK